MRRGSSVASMSHEAERCACWPRARCVALSRARRPLAERGGGLADDAASAEAEASRAEAEASCAEAEERPDDDGGNGGGTGSEAAEAAHPRAPPMACQNGSRWSEAASSGGWRSVGDEARSPSPPPLELELELEEGTYGETCGTAREGGSAATRRRSKSARPSAARHGGDGATPRSALASSASAAPPSAHSAYRACAAESSGSAPHPVCSRSAMRTGCALPSTRISCARQLAAAPATALRRAALLLPPP